MKKENIYKPFEIIYEKTNHCPIKDRVFNFFEFVYIRSGSGEQNIKMNKSKYGTGDLFLISPDDCHTFDVKSTTEFLLIKFNITYIRSTNWCLNNKSQLEYILSNVNNATNEIIKIDVDKYIIQNICEAIVKEHANENLYSQEIIKQLINSLILLVARNISAYIPSVINENTDKKIQDILHYIQNNITNPDKTSIQNISNHYNISEQYLSHYFKKHTNLTIREYLIRYRLKMLENRLLYSEYKIYEIADEFGFTDESHLIKFFKQHTGSTPSKFRKDRLISR
ncbi:AraC family transcriptional regulator [Apibacter adventoris]|uniref:AraC family transcriptional regulator n=1 Tax=Apibacter adventoris TaxID=1679466 RepID=A0A2S8AEM8_9FLAO|nr:AraC family transcriptional regulator [Apibacter adventoris]PQL93447.1 AraC family transcriptional regulator [Apibacter adventoris]